MAVFFILNAICYYYTMHAPQYLWHAQTEHRDIQGTRYSRTDTERDRERVRSRNLITFVIFYIAITLYYYTGAVVRRYKGHSAHVLSLYAHRESQKFISGGQDKRALMWDTRMSVPVQTFQSDANSIGRSISSKT